MTATLRATGMWQQFADRDWWPIGTGIVCHRLIGVRSSMTWRGMVQRVYMKLMRLVCIDSNVTKC